MMEYHVWQGGRVMVMIDDYRLEEEGGFSFRKG